MAWYFVTDREFQQKLDWMAEFVRAEVEPLDLLFRAPADPFDPNAKAPKMATRRRYELRELSDDLSHTTRYPHKMVCALLAPRADKYR
jgi:hypothetical protein